MQVSQDMVKPAVIAIENLSFRYGEGETAFWALRDINLTIHEGELVAIMGASGSGKSTLMNLLGTLATTSDGLLTLQGEQVSALGDEKLATLRNKQIGFIFQQFHLLPRLTVLENVLLPTDYVHPTPSINQRRAYRQHAMTLLARLGIADQALKYPASLSGGQKQRVAIARALVMDPKMILADEPTGALDSKTSAEVLEIFAELNREGRTIILITHDPSVTKVARRRIELRDGKIIEDAQQAGLTPEHRSLNLAGSFKHSITAPKPWREALAIFFAPFREAWQALFSSKLRTGLTSLGLIIGVSSITTMLTLGQAAQEVILGIFNQAGSDRIYIGPDYLAARNAGSGYWDGLDIELDLPALQNTFKNYGRIVPLGESPSQKVYAGGNQFDVQLESLYNSHDFSDKGMRIARGRMLAPRELFEGARVAMVGSDFAEKMFPPGYEGRRTNPNFPIGELLSVRDRLQTTLAIVGIVAKRDTTFESPQVNTRVYLPMSTYAKYTGQKNVTWISVVPNRGVEHRWIADSVTNYLSMKTGLKYPFRAHVPEELIGRIMMFINVFQGLTALIGGLCIVVGGIGIMNIMLVTITERIREIGLRKALGASGSDITRQFLLECVLLCGASGIVGTLAGIAFCNLVSIVGHALLPETIPNQILLNPTGITAGLVTALGAGLVFGMMPALKAARLDPAEALRSE